MQGQTHIWTERHLVVRSMQQAQSMTAALRKRLAQAQAEVERLNVHKQGKRRYADDEALQQAGEAILKGCRVEGLLKLTLIERVEERAVRAYGDRPAMLRTEREVSIQVGGVEQAVQAALRWFGWRVYATNQPQETLPLARAVLAYREEYLVERGFGRLKGKPLSLTPMYLQSDERATGLVRLLTIGLRILTLLEFRVRQRLAARKEKLAGLYAGNPKRATHRPTAEVLLEAFKDIHLSVVTPGEQLHRHLTPLTALQKSILDLLGSPLDIYTKLTPESLTVT